MKTKKIYVPRFPWFYESYLSELIDRTFTDEDGNYSEDLEDKFWEENKREDIYNQIGKAYYNIFKERYWELAKSIGIELWEYIKVVSPRYYNYSTDDVNINISYDYIQIIEALRENREAFSKYIKEENTSYDGFTAYGENEFTSYIQKILENESLEAFELTQVLDFFIAESLKDTEEEFYDTIEGELFENFYF